MIRGATAARASNRENGNTALSCLIENVPEFRFANVFRLTLLSNLSDLTLGGLSLDRFTRFARTHWRPFVDQVFVSRAECV
jgi:hypothetical protein